MEKDSKAIATLLKGCVGTPAEKLLPTKLQDMASGLLLAEKVSAIRHLSGNEDEKSAEQIAEVLYEQVGSGTIVKLHRMVNHLLTIQTVEQVYENFMEDIQNLQGMEIRELKCDKYEEADNDDHANPDS